MKDKEITAEITRRLRLTNEHKKDIYFPEFRWSAGISSSKRADAFFISSKNANFTVTYEIKANRWDFTRDMKNANKHSKSRQYSSLFYFATPKGLLNVDDIPPWAGLVEFDLEVLADDNNQGMHVVKQAPILPRMEPSWDMIAGLVKRMQKPAFRFKISGWHFVSDSQLSALKALVGQQMRLNKSANVDNTFMMRALAIVGRAFNKNNKI